MVNSCLSLENCKLEQYWDTAPYLLEWAKLKTLMLSTDGQERGTLNPFDMPPWKDQWHKWYSHFGRQNNFGQA
jgi:hypothetical protein